MRIAGWFFAFLVLAIGLVNTFWGNDQGYGIFVMLSSLFFFQSSDRLFESENRSGYSALGQDRFGTPYFLDRFGRCGVK